MDDRKTEYRQTAICDLADLYIDAEIARGAVFTEGLSNWAVNKAEREIIPA